MQEIVRPLPARQGAKSLKGSVPETEWQARVDLAAAHHFFALKGCQDDHLLYNHLSMRVPGEPAAFLIKPHDLLFREVTASNLLKVSLDGPALGFKENVNPAGYAIHSAILQARPDVGSVMHLHSHAGMTVSALDGGLIFLTQESMRFYNRVGYHDFEGVAEIEEGPAIVRDLGVHNALILRNHGLLTCGRTVADAAKRLYNLIRLCEIQLAALSSGQKIRQPSSEICERTAQMFDRHGAAGGSNADWLATLRWLDWHDCPYRE